MNVFARVPRPVAWLARIVGWTLGLAIMGAIVLAYGNFRLSQHLRECLLFPTQPRSPNALVSTQRLLACADQKSGPLERLLLYRNRKAVSALPNVPCPYAGTWTASRAGVVYKVTLQDDSRFEAEPAQGSQGNWISGSWGVYKDSMVWLYNGKYWPPVINAIKQADDDASFTLVEADGSTTRYALIARAQSQTCKPVPSRTVSKSPAKAQQARSAPAAPPGPARMRPAEGLSRAQKSDYEQLHFSYIETFRILGRAKACNHPAADQRMQDFMKEMEQRHGPNNSILMTALLGFAAGNENRLVGNEKDQTQPPVPVACDVIAGQMNSVQLPDIPLSLVLREGEPVDRIRQEASAATGPYRLVTRSPGEKGAAEHLVIHREKVAFRSTREFENDRLVEAPTPVLLVATKDPVRKCGDGKPYFTWHAVSLPSWGDSIVGDLEGADCMVVWPYNNYGRTGLCAWLNTEFEKRGSLLYLIEDSGTVVPNGERPAGVCPK